MEVTAVAKDRMDLLGLLRKWATVYTVATALGVPRLEYLSAPKASCYAGFPSYRLVPLPVAEQDFQLVRR